MYFLNHGIVEVLVGPNEEKVAELTDGNLFGEMALLGGHRRASTIKAKEFCDCRVVHSRPFASIMKRFPKEQEHFREIYRERVAKLEEVRAQQEKRERQLAREAERQASFNRRSSTFPPSLTLVHSPTASSLARSDSGSVTPSSPRSRCTSFFLDTGSSPEKLAQDAEAEHEQVKDHLSAESLHDVGHSPTSLPVPLTLHEDLDEGSSGPLSRQTSHDTCQTGHGLSRQTSHQTCQDGENDTDISMLAPQTPAVSKSVSWLSDLDSGIEDETRIEVDVQDQDPIKPWPASHARPWPWSQSRSVRRRHGKRCRATGKLVPPKSPRLPDALGRPQKKQSNVEFKLLRQKSLKEMESLPCTPPAVLPPLPGTPRKPGMDDLIGYRSESPSTDMKTWHGRPGRPYFAQRSLEAACGSARNRMAEELTPVDLTGAILREPVLVGSENRSPSLGTSATADVRHEMAFCPPMVSDSGSAAEGLFDEPCSPSSHIESSSRPRTCDIGGLQAPILRSTTDEWCAELRRRHGWDVVTPPSEPPNTISPDGLQNVKHGTSRDVRPRISIIERAEWRTRRGYA